MDLRSIARGSLKTGGNNFVNGIFYFVLGTISIVVAGFFEGAFALLIYVIAILWLIGGTLKIGFGIVGIAFGTATGVTKMGLDVANQTDPTDSVQSHSTEPIGPECTFEPPPDLPAKQRLLFYLDEFEEAPHDHLLRDLEIPHAELARLLEQLEDRDAIESKEEIIDNVPKTVFAITDEGHELIETARW